MAYAYPATIDLSQDVQTSSRGSISGLSGSELRKKMFDPASVILAEFKVCSSLLFAVWWDLD